MDSKEEIIKAIAYGSIAAASIFYTWLWWYPKSFRSLISRSSDPCAVMAFWANVLKVLQFGSMAMLTDWKAAFTMDTTKLVIALALIGFGQHLNALVFKLLGLHGTYYGCRFGKSIPWVTAYPYSHISDPQYWGGILSCMGASFFAPVELTAWWAANYFYLMWLEREEPAGKAD